MSHEPLSAFWFAHASGAARSQIRNILHYQFVYEAAQRTRQRLLVALTALSGILWLAVARRSLLSDAIVRAALTAWVVVLVAAIGALVTERHCRRRHEAALEDARSRREEEKE
jgi:hypothetical protein